MNRIVIALSLMMVLVAGVVGEEGEKENAVEVNHAEEVKQVMRSMILLLENGHARQVLFRYAKPSTIEGFRESGRLDSIADSFAKGKSDFLLKALKSYVKIEPAVDKEKNQVTFKDEKIGKKMIFIKINDVWFLED
jgi:hypothetical protein